jgi:hypothetical protein
MAGNMPGKSNDGKRKNMKETIIIPMVVAVAFTREIMAEESNKTVECFNCGKKGHYSTDCSAPRKNDNEN